MYMLSEGGRYGSWIALLFLNAGRGSLLAPSISPACSYPYLPFCYHNFQASGEDRVWGQELLIFWVCAELLGYREKWTFKEKGWWKGEDLLSCLETQKGPLVKWKGSFWGRSQRTHVGWNVGSPCWPGTSRLRTAPDRKRAEEEVKGSSSPCSLLHHCMQGMCSWLPGCNRWPGWSIHFYSRLDEALGNLIQWVAGIWS